VVVCLCLLGTAAFLFLFQRDLNRSLRRLDQEPAGFVSFRSGAALRRFQDRNIWDRLQREAPVYNGDLIRTADRSEVAIGFSGGALVDVSENSLIRVSLEEGAPRIDFSRGTISVQAGESERVNISFGKNRVQASAGSTINIDIKAGADTDTDANTGAGEEMAYHVQVLEGNASLISPEGEQEAAAGTALTFTFVETTVFDEPLIAAVPVEAVKPVEPPPIAAVPVEPPPPEPEPPAVVPAETPPVRPPPAPVKPPPPPRRPSPLPAPPGREPGNGYRIDPETLRESRTIVFRWNPVAGAEAYIFTLFHETGPRQRQPVLTVEGPETSYTLEDLSLLDLGRFVWQVEAVNRKTNRRGSPGENLFTVDIPQPEIPRGRKPGDLYAR
jgi:hypothetical protein